MNLAKTMPEIGDRLRDGWPQLAVAITSAAALWLITSIIYNLYFHPLRNFPGPLLHRASTLAWGFKQLNGTQAFDTQKFHERYGPIVRISPHHLSFTDPQAWKDIYGHQVGNKLNAGVLRKSWPFYRTVAQVPDSIITAEGEEHQRLRRALSHGFSDSSIREQEPTILKYVNLLVSRLHEGSKEGSKKLNMEAWYNWTTFDVIGDLVFGQGFGSLESVSYHPWVESIFKSVPISALLIVMGYIGVGALIHPAFVLAGRALKNTHDYTEKMLQNRLRMKGNHDLFEEMAKRQEEWGMPFEKLSTNANILVLAGSETTATTLAGATYLLLKHPDTLHKLQQEVRSTFKSASEITVASASKLSYMLAVLNESLRLYPPVVSNLIRTTPPEGIKVAGHFVPGGVMVEVQPWSANHSKENWVNPWDFVPERFLDTETAKSQGNKFDSLQPFSYGPRNCIGKSLAYAEMRLILARLVYEFDMALDDGSKAWISRQKAWTLWNKVPLNVYLTSVRNRA